MPHGMAWRGAAVETFRRTAEGPWPVRPSTASTASGQRPAQVPYPRPGAEGEVRRSPGAGNWASSAAGGTAC